MPVPSVEVLRSVPILEAGRVSVFIVPVFSVPVFGIAGVVAVELYQSETPITRSTSITAAATQYAVVEELFICLDH
jgi:hypothetical protein